MKLTILVDNYVESRKLKAEHGFSMLIEADDERILFDCGQSDLILSNAKVMGVELNNITKIILSHGHYDHTGGLLYLLKYLSRGIKIYAHSAIFEEKFSRYKDFNGYDTNRYIGIPEKIQTYEKKGAKFLLSKDTVLIDDNIYFSGQINKAAADNRDNMDNAGDLFFTKDNGSFIKDPIHDDISVFINLPELLVIITGCAHSGIINIINKAKELKLCNKDITIIGGFHLSTKEDAYIDNIIKEFKRNNVKFLIPMHCTGFNAISRFEQSFGENCEIGSVGKVLEF